jgi:hypothetical protein
MDGTNHIQYRIEDRLTKDEHVLEIQTKTTFG